MLRRTLNPDPGSPNYQGNNLLALSNTEDLWKTGCIGRGLDSALIASPLSGLLYSRLMSWTDFRVSTSTFIADMGSLLKVALWGSEWS
jgi:hypothetical protein